jgi:hypothetical protein
MKPADAAAIEYSNYLSSPDTELIDTADHKFSHRDLRKNSKASYLAREGVVVV